MKYGSMNDYFSLCYVTFASLLEIIFRKISRTAFKIELHFFLR